MQMSTSISDLSLDSFYYLLHSITITFESIPLSPPESEASRRRAEPRHMPNSMRDMLTCLLIYG